MKIISTFHDYYDGAQAYGHDPARTYHRASQGAKFELNVDGHARPLVPFFDALPRRGYYADRHIALLLLFCGRVYPLFAPRRRISSWEERIETPLLPAEWVRRYEAWRGDEDRARREEAKMFFEGIEQRRDDPDRIVTRKRMEEVFDRTGGREGGEALLIALEAPCAVVLPPAGGSWPGAPPEGSVAVRTNPRLGDLGFQRILNPYACYQEIETFLGNQLAPPDLAPDRVGSDEVLARQKGFDDASFRTAAPGTKKENRARNRARKKGL